MTALLLAACALVAIAMLPLLVIAALISTVRCDYPEASVALLWALLTWRLLDGKG